MRSKFSLSAYSLLLLAFNLLLAQSLTYDNTDVPVIYPRSTWETDETLKRLFSWIPERGAKSKARTEGTLMPEAQEIPDYWPVSRIIIHDQGCDPQKPGCNDDLYDPVYRIQNIYRYHAVTRGWGDIGYHFIIDRQGRIYEGRFGGNGVRGAHLYHDRKCQNFNLGTIGILLLGNYQDEAPPQVMIDSLVRLIAWLCLGNSLNPETLSLTTKVWANPIKGEKNGKTLCDLSQGSWGALFTGPVVLTHKDIEQGNSDVGKLDLVNVRQKAAQIKKRISKFLFTTSEKSGVFSLEKGKLFKLASSKKDFSLQPGQKFLKIAVSQLEYFPYQKGALFKEGSLLQVKGSKLLYLIEAGKKRLIYDKVLLSYWDLKDKRIQEVSLSELSNYPSGQPLLFPQGALIRAENHKKVYLILDGKRRHITSAALFRALGLSWQDILNTTPELVEAHPLGQALKLPTGVVVKDPQGFFYLIKGGRRFWIPRSDLLEALGLDKEEPFKLNQEELGVYFFGGYAKWPDGTLIQEIGKEELFLVWDQKRYLIADSVLAKSLSGQKKVIAMSSDQLKSYPVGQKILTSQAYQNLVSGKSPSRMVSSFKEKIAELRQKLQLSEILLAKPQTLSQFREITQKSTSTQKQELSSQSETGPSQIRVALCWERKGECTLPKNQDIQISVSSDYEVFVNGVSQGVKPKDHLYTWQYDETRNLKIVPQDKAALIQIVNFHDFGWKKTLNDNVFRGRLEIQYSEDSQGMFLVNELSLEEYLKGLAEGLSEDTLEYKKLLSLIARTYAYYYLTQDKRYPQEDFHLKNLASDQLYRGYNYTQRAGNWSQVVQETAGKIITYQGRPIVAAYSSDSGGVTKNACLVWPKYCGQDGKLDSKFSYLQGGIKDPQTTQHNPQKVALSHGVGLSAAGARELIRQGKNYEEIIKYYYPGVEIEKVY